MNTKKFVAVAAVAFAFAFAFSATAATFDFGSSTIKKGSTGTYAMNVQLALNACGAANPALSTDGKFGAKSVAALMAFQASKGLTSDGKAGAMSKAALNACGSTTTTTTTTTTTGTTTTGTTALTGGAGNIQSFTVLGSPSNIQVGEGATNTQVLGFEVRADAGSDLALSNLRVTLNNASGIGSTWVSRYISSVGVYQGATLVGSAGVADFSQNGTSYSKTIALNGVRVPANGIVDLYVAVSANGTIDSADANAQFTVTADSLRYQDATGVVLTSTNSATQTFRFLKLSGSANVKLKLTEDMNNPKDRTVVANYTQTVNDVSLLKFALTAQGSDMYIKNLILPATAVGVTNAKQISSYYKLKYNGSVVSSYTLTATGTTPDIEFGTTTTGSTSLNGGLGSIKIVAGTTANFEVTADINAMATGTGVSTVFDAGDTLKVDLPNAYLTSNTDVKVEDQVGNALDTTSTHRTGSVTGYNATFRIEGLTATKSGENITETINNTSGVITQARYTMDLSLAATGTDFFVPETASAQSTGTVAATYTKGITYAIVDNSGSYVNLGSNVSASVSPLTTYSYSNGLAKIPEGSSIGVRLSVSISDGSVPAGQYRVVILSVNGDPVDSTTNLPSYATTPTSSFRTAYNLTSFQ